MDDKKFNITILNGSPRNNGVTASLLKSAKEILASKPNIRVNYYDLSDYEMQFCKGCISCYKTGVCIIKNDGIEELASKIRKSDGIIIGTPTNGSNVTPILKNLMDRSHFLLEQALHNKQCLSIISYEIAEGNIASKILDKFLMIAGGIKHKSIVVKTNFNENPLMSIKVQRKMQRTLKGFTQSIQKNKRKSFIDWLLVDIIVVKLIWKPVFLKNPDKYAGILKAWKETGIK